jgi:H/ACA ribonucleoprotein complex subunit 4
MCLVKSEEESDSCYGKRPEERTVEELIKNSVLIVDKHSGPTSHQITDWAKKIFCVKKAGHSGTLDPAVTGVLPIALDNATKAMQVLMGLEKEYVGVMHLHKEVQEELLRSTVKNFIGKIIQIPPVKSAVARKPREREIKFFDILEIEGRDVLFKVSCEAGTYIRKLCDQIGRDLGCGANMKELRRLRVGNFTEEQSHSLLEVKDAYEFWKAGDAAPLKKILIPVEYAINQTKKVFIKDSVVDSVCNGSPVFAAGITRIQEGIDAGYTVAVYTQKEELVALGIAKMNSEKMYKAKRGVVVRTDRVLMSKGIYPKEMNFKNKV